MNIGDILKTRSCGNIEVLQIDGHNKIKIKFLDTGSVVVSSAGNIRKGVVRDFMAKKTFGVGFVGVGSYKASVNRSHTKQYQTWKGMMQRCYSKFWHKRHPTYIGCTVCDDWHNFQVFAEWFDSNYVDGCELDKDILVKGNKVYCPDMCLFVSKNENVVSALSKDWVLNDFLGGTLTVNNLKKFCLSFGLDYQKTRDVVNSNGCLMLDLSKFKVLNQEAH